MAILTDSNYLICLLGHFLITGTSCSINPNLINEIEYRIEKAISLLFRPTVTLLGYINQLLLAGNVTPQYIQTKYVRKNPIGHN